MTEPKKILRIVDTISAIGNAQIAVEDTADPILGFKMWGGKDSDGIVTKWLAKNKPIQVTTATLTGGTTTGSTGLMSHNTNGLLAGQINTLAEINAIITDATLFAVEDFDANTIIKADTDDTPVALTVPEQTLIGRITAGNIDALTVAEVKTLLALNLDDAYNADAGASDITVDAGDVTWALTGAYSHIINLELVTGTADGFIVEDTTISPSTKYWKLLRVADNEIDLNAILKNIDYVAIDIVSIKAGASSDFTLGARGGTVTLNEVDETSLDTTAQSIVGAINEVHAYACSVTLDEAYNNDGGAANVGIDAGSVIWTIEGAYNFDINLTDADDDHGFHVFDATDYFRLYKTIPASINLNAELYEVNINSSQNMNLSGSADLNLEFSNVVLDTNGVFFTAETTTPTPIADFGAWYTKADNKPYFQDGAGVEHEIAINGAVQPQVAFYATRSSGAQALTSTVEAIVVLPNEDYDDGSNFNVSTYKFTAPTDGYYSFSASAEITIAIGGRAEIRLYKNATLIAEGDAGHQTAATIKPNCSCEIKLAANDTVEVRAYQATGYAATLQNTNLHFSGVQIGEI